MKIYLSTLAFLLLSCSNSTEKPSSNILSKAAFETILKEIHLAKAAFEVNRNNSIENAKNELTKAYFDIYKKNQISEKDFQATLNYYCKNPAELESAYTNILGRLKKQASKIDQP